MNSSMNNFNKKGVSKIVIIAATALLMLFIHTYSHANSPEVITPVQSYLLLNDNTPDDNVEPSQPGLVELRSGQQIGNTIVFSNADQNGLDVTFAISNNSIRELGPNDFNYTSIVEPIPFTDTALSIVDEGVYLSGFNTSETLTITFSKLINIKELTVLLGLNSPTIDLDWSSPTLDSIDVIDNGVTTNVTPTGSSFQVVGLNHEQRVQVNFNLNASTTSIIFQHQGSPGSSMTFTSFSLAP